MCESERKIAYIFPGQGAQRGNKRDQVSVQLEVVTSSCSLIDHVKKSKPQIATVTPICFAGHSVGIWSAIYASEMIDYQILLKSIQKRAELMELVGTGRMVAIVGREWYQAREVWSVEGVSLAAINCPGQFVISGRENDVVQAENVARQMGGRVLEVNAAGPNHSELMEQVQPEFRKYVYGLGLSQPRAPIILNTSGLPTRSVSMVQEELVAHLPNTIQWEQSVRNMILLGADTFVEWGSDTLSKFVKRINSEVRSISITNYQQTEELEL